LQGPPAANVREAEPLKLANGKAMNDRARIAKEANIVFFVCGFPYFDLSSLLGAQ
jgi:hypothetical protein